MAAPAAERRVQERGRGTGSTRPGGLRGISPVSYAARACTPAHADLARSAGVPARLANDKVQRSVLPIPEAPHVGLTTYGVKDPDTHFPPIETLAWFDKSWKPGDFELVT